ncbi:AAA family ATPase [Synechococcus lacustris]|uniref:AAA family ATPase n=1 Tax=Synechococcus lacustris TaxID=2116544 RepID=UPI00333E6276
MRIAISGSHSLGKSTVVRDWLHSNPDYLWEDEPYRVLSFNGPYEIAFQDKSTRLHNGLQLFYSISRLHRYDSSECNVIFDRCPIDYLAYSQYTAFQSTTDIDKEFVLTMVDAVRESLDHLDILAFIPVSEQWPVPMEDDGIRPPDLKYRNSVDMIFKQIYRDGLFDLLPAFEKLKLIELVGDSELRLKQIQLAIESISA